ncbi:dihydroxyacetone kinase subunit DhaL [Mycobacterium sp. smrl_JER01]|uniref:dihydroxyacetone kinase subunit DhaL n=1 Tax=Mycobacterium sp. smrl_JER01 TaxID=3402633 RepID=UPI003AD6B5C9
MEKIDSAALVRWIEECARQVTDHEDALCDLDAASGDADHGSNLARGFAAVRDAVASASERTPAAVLKDSGMTLVDTIGGSSGALYGTFFLRMAKSAGTAESLDAPMVAEMFRAGAGGVAERGKVELGDKTLYDALAPAVGALERVLAAGGSLADALDSAADAAERGRDGTADMVARKGRASYLRERTRGNIDAGAASMALIVRAATSMVR